MPIRLLQCGVFSLLLWGCDEPEHPPEPETRGECTANVDPGDAVWECDGDDLLWCVCDNYVDNEYPDQRGQWVKQDILCTCDEWVAGNCPVE